MLRLTGGEFRGRGIHTPASIKTRPTQARLRQALFNSIQTLIPESRILDLFAGSGALGLEALSRGASFVVFVESHNNTARLIEKNIKTLEVGSRTKVLTDSVDEAIERLIKLGPFDIVLADPPYEEGWEMRLLQEMPWDQLLTENGRFCLEWGKVKSRVDEEGLPAQIGRLEKVREKIYGDSVLTTYSLK